LEVAHSDAFWCNIIMVAIRSLNRGFNPFKRISFRKQYTKTTTFIKRRPLGSFFIALGLLLLVIIIGHIANQPKVEETPPTTPVAVQLYSIGESPKVAYEAKVEKAGVIKIIAQTSGIVQDISVKEGSSVSKGEQIMTLSTNYQGGNASAVQAQIAQTQYQNVLDTFDEQENEISNQRNIANDTYNSYTDQQAIATQSANNTSSLINNNQAVLNTLNQQLTNDQNSGASQSAILAEESEINSLQGAQNSLQSSLSNLQEQTNGTKAPGALATDQRNLTMQQLDLQEKSLELNKEVTGLQANLAQINADTMLPASPVDGVVERVFVHPGDQVSSGTELAVISADENSPQTIAVVDVPMQIAQNISKLEKSDTTIGGNTYYLKPFYISTDPTDGLLYSVFYTLPKDAVSSVTDGEYVNFNIPIGAVKTGATVPFVPIDAVYQTQSSSYILVDINNKAVSRQVTVGNVYGNFIEITNGLNYGDQVILDRSVVAGDKVNAN
jgi:multidrug efflux pump subunit AcrA (membrane-fusion protein)